MHEASASNRIQYNGRLLVVTCGNENILLLGTNCLTAPNDDV